MRWIQVVCWLLLLGSPVLTYGTQPVDALKAPIDEVIRILKDPQYNDAAKKSVQREKIWNIIQGIFDFKEISMRTLAGNWKKLSPEQQKEFINVFSRFLGNIYLDRIQSGYSDEKIVYESQEMLSETKAVVKTKIVRDNNMEIPVDYRMRKRGNTWKIYDVRIEGVSLVKNYRTQFKQILMKETPDQLIERIKRKVEEQKRKTVSETPLSPEGVVARSRYAWQHFTQGYFLLLLSDIGHLRSYLNH
ncbi:MAG: ABC transporter substrate-binding protein [Deltaproteobacteria bacterium]|nr:ABC transporter substrate-binding protein [Deltaproteobacteria bacterium]MBW1961496.1 ABC transporter substrate-binding protein [Deltaproteobacteria bacterium]MBW1994891.1 ABC transporter substrate-binding protein [Deltaproteobacteria bacterium]MBW2150690.1 ABC transporter substrate-binding protein [Deltaproteobacteria bacterium]